LFALKNTLFYAVGIVGNVLTFRGSGTTGSTGVFSLGGSTVGSSTFEEGLLGSLNIFRLSLPGSKD